MAAEQHVESENHEKPQKRKYETTVLDNFNKLTNGQEKIRIKSGVNLLKHLTDDGNNEKENEIKYTITRLIRGLGSSKIQTRTGFFTCLVGLLNLHPISIEDIFEIVNKELHKGGSNSKSENADVCSGQILVSGAVLRTDLYDISNENDKKRVLELLLNAGKERTYLNLASYTFLTDLYKKITPEEFNKIVFPLIKTELSQQWSELNLDGLYLLLETEKKFPKIVNGKFLSKNLGRAKIFCKESLPQLCQILTTIPRVLSLKHPVFDLVLQKLSETDLIVDFLEELDKFLQRQNRNKYFVFTKFLSGFLSDLSDPNIVYNLLTKNFIQQTISTFKTNLSKDREFNENVTKLFDLLLQTLKKDETTDKTRLEVLKKLLFYPGTFIFEKVTKTKLIQNITLTLKQKGVKKLSQIYSDVILAVKDRQINETQSEKWWNIDRVYASHLQTKLLNHPSMHDENEWKIQQLIFLMKLGLFQNEEIGLELAESFKETFFSSLDLKLSKLDDLKTILFGVFNELNNSDLENDLRNPLTSEDLKIWKKTYEKITLKKKKNIVFVILFLHLGLQMFNNVKLATDSLNELFLCFDRIEKKQQQKEESESDPLWIEVMVDLFLNLLSHNSHLLRNVINCVFPHLCKDINVNAIHQILSVLDPKNETNPLSKYEDSESEESESENEDQSGESDSEPEEEEDLDEEETVNDKLKMALHEALRDSDNESLDLDDLDEEAGEKLDEALGEAFKRFKPNLGRKKKQSKDDQTLTHFRVRVLDLIEIYLNTQPSMLLTLEIMLPLLQILEFSIRDEHQKPLQDRVRSCLKKLTGLRKFEDFNEVTDEVLVNLLGSLLEKGTKNSIIINDMGEKISDCCIFIIHCYELVKSQQNKKKKSKFNVWNVIKDNLQIFFVKRDCLVPYVLFKSVLQLNYEGILQLYDILKGFIFTESVRPFRRYQAIELLTIFYQNHRFINANQELVINSIKQSQNEFLLECVSFFTNFNPIEKKIKAKFLTNLFDLLNSIKTSKLADDFDWVTIGNGVRECRSMLTFCNDTKTAFRKLCKSLQISNIVKMKNNTVKLNDNENDDEDDTNKPSKQENKKNKKKKLNKDKLKLKKETKELRLQSLSEGLGSKRKLSLLENGDDNKSPHKKHKNDSDSEEIASDQD